MEFKTLNYIYIYIYIYKEFRCKSLYKCPFKISSKMHRHTQTKYIIKELLYKNYIINKLCIVLLVFVTVLLAFNVHFENLKNKKY